MKIKTYKGFRIGLATGPAWNETDKCYGKFWASDVLRPGQYLLSDGTVRTGVVVSTDDEPSIFFDTLVELESLIYKNQRDCLAASP